MPPCRTRCRCRTSSAAASPRRRSACAARASRSSYVRDNSDKPRNTVIGQDPGAGTTAAGGLDRHAEHLRRAAAAGGSRRHRRRPAGGAQDADGRRLRGAGAARGVDDGEAQPRHLDDAVAGLAGRARLDDHDGGLGRARAGGGAEGRRRVRGRRAGGARTRGLPRRGRSARRMPRPNPGTVLAQNPAPGATVASGSTVTITVAEESEEVTVPDVVGRSQNAATSTLSGAGLRVDVEEAPVDSPDDDGKVLSQSVDAGFEGRARLDGDDHRRRLRPRPRIPSRADADDAADDAGAAASAADHGSRMRVAVLSGGRSSEHEVSLVSGASVSRGLRSAGHEVVEVMLTRAGTWLHEGEEVRCARAAGCWMPTSPSPCCTARSARTARCRGCSRCSTCRTSGRACWRRRCASTRSSRRT